MELRFELTQHLSLIPTLKNIGKKRMMKKRGRE
jgi:hypothetical protein